METTESCFQEWNKCGLEARCRGDVVISYKIRIRQDTIFNRDSRNLVHLQLNIAFACWVHNLVW